MRRTLLTLAGLACVGSVAVAGPVRFYVANDDHTDYLWTADADTYAKAFVDQLDFQLRLIDQTASNAPDYRERYNCDGSEWLWAYEQKKSATEFDRLMARVKDGSINVPLNTLVSCYGGQPIEGVLRGMYYAGRLERRYGVRFPTALAMENQTLPRGLASLFAGSGVKYSWRGVCGCASKIPTAALGERPHEIYWYTGADGGRVLMKWYSLGKNNIGGYWEAGDPASSVAAAEANAGFRRRYADPQTGEPYEVVGLFGFGGDDLERKTGTPPPATRPAVPGLPRVVASPYVEHFFDAAARLSTRQRQVIVSNEVDFFEDFERRYGRTLPVESVTYGNEWDLYSASMAETSGRVKRAVEKLRAAELLATLVGLKYPAFTERFVGDRDRAFRALGMYWEHDWTADGPVSRGQRAAWEELPAATIDSYVDALYAEGVVRLGGLIPRPEKANRFFVLNPLGWSRTDAADLPYRGPRDVHVRDVASGGDVPHQFVSLDGVQRLRVLAADVPAAGYKVFEVLPGPGVAPADLAANVTGGMINNGVVHVTVERDGALSSLADERAGSQELAKEIAGLRLNDLAPNTNDGEPLAVENAGPVSVTLRARSDAGVPHTTAVTLLRGSDRVDVRDEITANFADVRYWSFGFDLPWPAVHTEEVGAINLDRLHKDGGDYADTHARYDHVTLNHFADVTAGDDTRGVTLSNSDLAFAKLGSSTPKTLDTATPQVHVLAGGQVDGRYLGVQEQNGATHFLQRFALRAHGAYDPAAAMRFALEHQNPLVCGPVISTPDGPNQDAYPTDQYSLMSVSDPDVLLWAVKPAEEGITHGVIARFWNVSGRPKNAMITFTPGLATAGRTTHIETDVEPVPLVGDAVADGFAGQQLRTYRLLPRRPTTARSE